MAETIALAVCYDCLHEIANDETPDGADPERKPRAGTEEWEVTLGGEHGEYCELETRGECDCEDLGFSWCPCDLCTSRLGGDRYAATAWIED